MKKPQERFRREWLSQLEDELMQPGPMTEDEEGAEAEESEGSVTDDPTEESSPEHRILITINFFKKCFF